MLTLSTWQHFEFTLLQLLEEHADGSQARNVCHHNLPHYIHPP